MKGGLGIEVGPRFVALCEVTVDSDGVHRHRFGRRELDLTERPTVDELADTCLALALELGVRRRTAVLSLARALSFAKPVVLPPVSDEDRRRVVALQPERFFPAADRPLVCDVEPLENGGMPVAHAAESEPLERLIQALSSRGFRVGAVLPAPAAMLRSVVSRAPEATTANWILVRREGSDLTAQAYRERNLLASRRIENFCDDPAGTGRELARTAERAFGNGGSPAPVRWLGWGELPDSVRASASTALRQEVRETLELPVPSDELGAFGAAVASLEETPRPDLLPPGVRTRRRQQTRWMTVACAALALLGGVALVWSLGEREERRLRDLDRAIARARPGAEAAAEARDRLRDLEGRIAAVDARMRERSRWTGLLNELSSAVPQGAWLTNLSVESSGRVALSGYGRTASALVPALEATDALARVELAAPATRLELGGRALEAFNLSAVLEGSAADTLAQRADRAEGETP